MTTLTIELFALCLYLLVFPGKASVKAKFKHLGCYGDQSSRTLADYKGAVTSAEECYDKCFPDMKIFGVQNQNECWSSKLGPDTYDTYGTSTSCKNGRGGTWTNDIYEIDHCFTNPCKNGGVCTNTKTLYKCDCTEEFIGNNCEKKNPCYPNPCQNNGKCTHNGLVAYCTCPEGFIGSHCEKKDPCLPNPCKNNGQCSKSGDNFFCACSSGFIGNTCNKRDPCVPNPCKNEGRCSLNGDTFDCICKPGFIGKTCESKDLCSSNPCKNHGKCSNVRGDFQCDCPSGFLGKICDKTGSNVWSDWSLYGPCSATCGEGVQIRKRSCKIFKLPTSLGQPGCTGNGFMSRKCDSGLCPDKCSVKPCKNGGICSVGSICACQTGFRGTTCDKTDHCLPNPCNNGGKCLDNGNDFVCVCASGFLGDTCKTKDRCLPNPCENGGKCFNNGNGFACVCPAGYLGDSCQTRDNCLPNPCSNGGRCLNNGNNFVCACESGFLGDTCQTTDKCFPNPCNNGGTCLNNGNGFICACTSGFLGDTCQTRGNCSPNPCRNGGACLKNGDKQFCLCTGDYIGDRCQTRGGCAMKPCQNGATCLNSGINFACVCQNGYLGTTCEIKDECTPNPCNGGSCVNIRNGFICRCPVGFLGDKCQFKDPCSPNPCIGGGTCYKGKNGFKCACPKGLGGNTCNTRAVDFCYPNPCENGATCSNRGNRFACSCKPGFRGTTCRVKESDCAPGREKSLGLASGSVDDDHMTASSYYKEGWEAWNGRLGHTEGAGCWGPRMSRKGEYLQVDFGRVKEVSKVSTQGRHGSNSWTKAYKVSFSVDGESWTPHAEEFPGNKDGDSIATNIISPSFNARLVRIYPTEFHEWMTLRVELYGCEIKLKDHCSSRPCKNGGVCSNVYQGFLCRCTAEFTGVTCEEKAPRCARVIPFGLATGSILDDLVTASSYYATGWEPWRGRLGHTGGAGCWGPEHNNVGEYLQIDLGREKIVSKVKTQGRYNADMWTKAFKLRYSSDGKRWNYYSKEFYGNWDRSTIKTNAISPAFKARYVRIYPIRYYRRMAIRMELYGCDV